MSEPKMTRFEFFEQGLALIGAKVGAISISMLGKYDRYKVYRDFLNSGYDDGESRQLAAKKCRCDHSTISRDIYWFERDDPNYGRWRHSDVNAESGKKSGTFQNSIR
jgi:hypothetical protein